MFRVNLRVGERVVSHFESVRGFSVMTVDHGRLSIGEVAVTSNIVGRIAAFCESGINVLIDGKASARPFVGVNSVIAYGRRRPDRAAGVSSMKLAFGGLLVPLFVSARR